MTALRMIVIADDITGAAEIAGIAHSYGLDVSLLCGGPASCGCAAARQPSTGAQVTVIATDTRSMTADEAVAETRRVARALTDGRASGGSDAAPVLFKKTDSALRGHVVAELSALLSATGYRRAIYLPANPSKGRIIRAGVYYIRTASADGSVAERPIAETDFRFDPEFPARTSSLSERFPDADASHILMPDATSAADISAAIARYADGATLFAGAADLFAHWLAATAPATPQATSAAAPQPATTPVAGSTLILCGSTQSRALDLGIPVAAMPRDVYDGTLGAADWLAAIDRPPATPSQATPSGPSLILTIPHTHLTGHDVAVRLRTVMAEVACSLIARHRPSHLIIEGGATAWATLRALGWTQFQIERQVAPGVVQMRAACGTLVTMKPGSYPWGGLF